MWLSDTSVKRPVFATVLSMLLIAIGALSFRDLTVRENPDTVAPTVQVQVGYPGANAEVIETRITQVLEAELSGIEGVKNIRSQSRDGQSSLTVEFYLDRNLDEAANDVRDRVSRVSRRLPDDADQVSVQKADADSQPIMWLTLASDAMSLMDLTDYMERYLLDRFATIPGVSQINIFGSGGPSMRVWIDRQALDCAQPHRHRHRRRRCTRENVELPAGRLESRDLDFQVRIARNFQTADNFRNLVHRARRRRPLGPLGRGRERRDRVARDESHLPHQRRVDDGLRHHQGIDGEHGRGARRRQSRGRARSTPTCPRAWSSSRAATSRCTFAPRSTRSTGRSASRPRSSAS